MLKDKKEMSNVIVTDYDIVLMNLVVKIFPTSYVLLYRHHITKNVRSRVKPAVGTKQIEYENGKVVKAGVVVEKCMESYNNFFHKRIIW